MAWWQKKILRYALSRTGLLADKALDLDNLDITLGKKNVVELKDVALNIKRINKIAQLPPSLRLETARVLSLRLTVPADIYQSSIVAEVDGVDLGLRFEEKSETPTKELVNKARAPATSRIPQHRKAHRRTRSPPPFDPGGLSDSDDAHLPTADELAKSFLLEEPAQGRRALEASVAAGEKGLEESVTSESSEGDDFGTGAAIGLPGFLASFLQGIVDRFQIIVRNVEAKVDIEVSGDGSPTIPVTFRLCVGSAALERVDPAAHNDNPNQEQHQGERQIKLTDLSIDFLSDAAIFDELSQLPSPASPADSRQRDHSPATMKASGIDQALSSLGHSATSSSHQSFASAAGSGEMRSPSDVAEGLHASILTEDADRFADAGEDDESAEVEASHSELEIQPGDDNISWGSRRSRSDAPVEDLWNSMISEDNLPQSLLLDRARTPRAQSSRNTSPTLIHHRRERSPYQRSLQGPGSWPTLEESPERHRSMHGPGSWPTFEDPQVASLQLPPQSPTQPPPEQNEPSQEDIVDNKRAALESSITNLYESTPSPAESVGSVDELSTSRLFTHEEAESMYLSAMSHSAKMHIPGGWGAGDAQSEGSQSPEISRNSPSEQAADSTYLEQPFDEDLAYGEQPYSTPGNVTPRAPSPSLPKAVELPSLGISKKASRRVVYLDFVNIWIPAEKQDEDRPDYDVHFPGTASSSFFPKDMPGTFSAYSEKSASRRQSESSKRYESNRPPIYQQQTSSSAEKPSIVSIQVGSIKCQLDLPGGRLLYRSLSRLSAIVGGNHGNKPQETDEGVQNHPSISLSVSEVSVAFKETAAMPVDKHSGFDPESNLITLGCHNVELLSRAPSTDIQFGKFTLFVGSSCLLSFARGHNPATSMIISEDTPDITLTLCNRMSKFQRPIFEATITTPPCNVVLDLPVIDETFDVFGGLSGVFEVGNSILSESTMASPTLSPTKTSKGVRFQGDPSSSSAETEYKANARIGGVNATLKGSGCEIELRTTTIKAVYREQGAVANVDQIRLSCPHTPTRSAKQSTCVDLSALHLEYLLAPQDKDIERLLSLITPSKDKYDDDDDILIDTLIRQRKKGAVARVSATDIDVYVGDWAFTESLSTLSDELGKLSAVAKYLPEDDRPGLLTLIRVKDLSGQLPVNERFGKLGVRLEDFHCAHIGLPALLALAIGDARVFKDNDAELIRSVVQLSGSENLPMIMARMLGDEVEPTLKIKLFNTCIEYSVPDLVALTNLDRATTGEEMVVEVAQSVADLALPSSKITPRQTGSGSDTSNSSKKMKVDLLIHDSLVGLTPENLSSKALLVFTDAHLSIQNPSEHAMRAQFELRKAGIFIADRVVPDDVETTFTTRASPNNTATKPKLVSVLAKRGFVSVGSIMAAKISLRVEQTATDQPKTVDAEVRNELLLLETCADSTQTLIATLNGLIPPTPPSKEPKYLTEPMTIEDMMASFTGDAFEKPEQRRETLFDVEEEPQDDSRLSLDMPTLGEIDDDLLAESELTSSLYGPVSGILGVRDDAQDADDAEEFPETVESLLEDDPFEMPTTPTEVGLSDNALMRELNKQSKPAFNQKSLDIGLYEIEDLGFDALGSNQSALGTQYRFNNPTGGRRKAYQPKGTPKLPFRLKMRDVHIIWNIYDGYDWQRTREGITQAVEQVELRMEERKAKRRQSANERDDEESVIGDFLFNSIYIGVPNSNDPQELRRQINRDIDELASETESMPVSGMSRPTTAFSASGQPVRPRPRQRKRLKLERSRTHKVAFELKGVSADVQVFSPEDTDVVSSIDVRVRDFEIFDNVPTSTWRKFLTILSNESGDREMSKPMVHIEVLNVRTLESFSAAEIVMHVSLLPLRLHVDQDALDFITRFFEFKDESASAPSNPSEQPFLQRVEIDTVDLQLDYKPKKVDYAGLRSGHTTEFMNFIILDAANIRLRHAIIYGIRGFDPLHKTLNDIWMPDVKRNQLPTVLAGLAPVRSLVNIGSGVRDVIAIPVREYKKDGRIVRSIQKGAYQFGKTTASELARLGAKVAIGTQTLLQGAEGFLTPNATSSGRSSSAGNRSSEQTWLDVGSDDDEHEPRAISAYANQPLGVLSGLRAAQRHLEYDLLTARDALIAVQGEILENAGAGSAAAAVARHAPTIILRPIIGTSRAVGTALLGVGNQIDRGNVRRIEDKYKRR